MSRSTFNEFASRHSKDQRFRAVEKLRDRESFFHEYIQELKTREKDGSHRRTDKETVRHSTALSTFLFFPVKEGLFHSVERIERHSKFFLVRNQTCRRS